MTELSSVFLIPTHVGIGQTHDLGDDLANEVYAEIVAAIDGPVFPLMVQAVNFESGNEGLVLLPLSLTDLEAVISEYKELLDDEHQ